MSKIGVCFFVGEREILSDAPHPCLTCDLYLEGSNVPAYNITLSTASLRIFVLGSDTSGLDTVFLEDASSISPFSFLLEEDYWSVVSLRISEWQPDDEGLLWRSKLMLSLLHDTGSFPRCCLLVAAFNLQSM